MRARFGFVVCLCGLVACGENAPAKTATAAPATSSSSAPLSPPQNNCDDDSYKPAPAWSGRAPDLPDPPRLK